MHAVGVDAFKYLFVVFIGIFIFLYRVGFLILLRTLFWFFYDAATKIDLFGKRETFAMSILVT